MVAASKRQPDAAKAAPQRGSGREDTTEGGTPSLSRLRASEALGVFRHGKPHLAIL